MKLDVGSGDRPSGDVNCDTFKDRTPHIRLRDNKIVVKGNFVLCDGEHLPFKDRVFSETYSSHTIEHVPNPFNFLKEMFRVTLANGTVLVKCPHRFSRNAKFKPYHLNYFNSKWFKKVLDKFELTVDSTYYYPLGEYLSFFRLPDELIVKAVKKNRWRN